MPNRSWKATGLLAPLWGRVGGRDALAERTGIQPATISGYNTGRLNLTLNAARRIALALDVTIYDLGAPAEIEMDGSPLLRQLAEIRSVLDELVSQLAQVLQRETGLAALVDKQATLLEQQTHLLESIEARVDARLGEGSGRARQTKR